MGLSHLSKDTQNWDSNSDGLSPMDVCRFILTSIHLLSSGDDIAIGLFGGPPFSHIVLPS